MRGAALLICVFLRQAQIIYGVTIATTNSRFLLICDPWKNDIDDVPAIVSAARGGVDVDVLMENDNYNNVEQMGPPIVEGGGKISYYSIDQNLPQPRVYDRIIVLAGVSEKMLASIRQVTAGPAVPGSCYFQSEWKLDSPKLEECEADLEKWPSNIRGGLKKKNGEANMLRYIDSYRALVAEYQAGKDNHLDGGRPTRATFLVYTDDEHITKMKKKAQGKAEDARQAALAKGDEEAAKKASSKDLFVTNEKTWKTIDKLTSPDMIMNEQWWENRWASLGIHDSRFKLWYWDWVVHQVKEGPMAGVGPWGFFGDLVCVNRIKDERLMQEYFAALADKTTKGALPAAHFNAVTECATPPSGFTCA